MTHETQPRPSWYCTLRGLLIGAANGAMLLVALQHWHVVPAALPDCRITALCFGLLSAMLLLVGMLNIIVAGVHYRRVQRHARDPNA